MMLSRQRAVTAFLLATGLLTLAILPGHAIDVVRLKLGTLEGEGWSAQAVSVELNWLDEGVAGLLLQAEHAVFPEAIGELSGVSLSCPRAQLTATEVHCAKGVLKAKSSVLGQQHIQIAFKYQLETGRIDTELRGVRVHDGTLALSAHLSESRWQLDASGTALSLPAVTRQLAAAGIALPVVDGSGQLDITAHINGVAAQLRKADVEIQLRAEEISNADGSMAAEQLDASLHATVETAATGMQVALELFGRQGALYVEPVFVQMPSVPLQLGARFAWLPAEQQLLLQSFSYIHPGSVQLEGHGHFSLAADTPLRELQLEVRQANFPSLYDTYLRPWLFGSLLAELDTSGQLSGTMAWQQGKLSQLSLEPLELSVNDREGRFALDSINGQVRWSDDAVPERSELAWAGGSVFRVALGASGIVFDSGSDFIRLAQRLEMPVLDGALGIDDFQLEFGEDGPLRWQVNGLLEPVSLSQLTLALGWPEMGGKLSGVIPNVRYDNGNLVVGGILLIRVFDGEVTLRNLMLEQPFGLVPRLQVDARIDNIDLETLTRTFSFGKIEGRLDGRIDGLEMESWRPVAFDAEFSTPEDDHSRHRISQKAVDNISSIGGGMGGVLSRSALRFFEDFPYDRLGIRCRLENGVCDMGGIAPAAEGYYLVKGRLIPPRLDVIGFADRVNWDTLIAQIMAVTRQQEMHVE
ncbi:MAG: hypothetical protein LJE75_13685 [Gammaproteobacteria bacterium]|jgi:hypothetical protein|nr:hypothetical protein [Gammaproteobacteria bacterium]